MWTALKVKLLASIFILKYCSSPSHGQMVILTRPEIEDPFKDNRRWEEFKLFQLERIGHLKTLVNNVWDLVDAISYPGVKATFKESFVKFQFRAFQQFFQRTHIEALHENSFSVINPFIGLRNIANLFSTEHFPSDDKMNQFKTKWTEVDFMALSIHQTFNRTADAILQAQFDKIPDLMKEVYEMNFTTGGTETENATTKSLTLEEMASKINEDMMSLGADSHLMRGLVQILRNIKQSNVDISSTINFFCYGHNKFGIIPELLDFATDATEYLVMMDLKKLVLDVYSVVLPLLASDSEVTVKDTLPQRNALWDKAVERVTGKFHFPYLDGTGWGSSGAPAVFKCDLAPKIGDHEGQWGKNVTTGSSPDPSPNYPKDPQSGPLSPEGHAGYFDDRSPLFQAVGFDTAFQGYIESELVLTSFSPSCSGTCEDFKYKTNTCDGQNPQKCASLRNYHCEAQNPGCLAKSSCPSYARNCVRASKNVTMCPSADPAKLYDWVNLNGNKILKQSIVPLENTTECSGGNLAYAMERWEMSNHIILNAPQYCELCLCTCMSPLKPENQTYFDIQPSLSDVAGGMIISAVRFVKEENVIRLAVEQGKPISKGLLDNSTLKWVDPLPFDTKDGNKTVPIGLNGFTKFNFDLIIAEPGTVITGIRFRVENEALNLEIQSTPITWPESDPEQITLVADESTWKIASFNSSAARKPITFLKPGNPLVQAGPSMPTSVLSSFVEFTVTSYEEDLGQTVIPLFDTQPVHFYEGRRWLRGIGTLHKGKPGSGGFISPIIIPAKPYTAVRYFPKPQPS